MICDFGLSEFDPDAKLNSQNSVSQMRRGEIRTKSKPLDGIQQLELDNRQMELRLQSFKQQIERQKQQRK
jgi:hypothetical protein